MGERLQFDSTLGGKGHQDHLDDRRRHRESLLNIVERSMTGERLVAEVKKVFAASGGPPQVLRLDNGPEMWPPNVAAVLRRQHRIVQPPPT